MVDGGESPSARIQRRRSGGGILFQKIGQEQQGIDPAGLRIVQRSRFRDEETDALDVTIAIESEADLPEADRAALVAAAHRCTVKRAIEDGTTIRIE